ncbi:MAG: hypothetical protein ABSD96_02515 [Candidatus Korobacteraceae bacterium]|jgi:hypothetical protein
MKKLVLVLVLACGPAWTQTVYSNLDDSNAIDMGGTSTGWGWCTTCAGGLPEAEAMAIINTADNVTTPSWDGASREFYITGPAYANGLWWYKVGPNDAASHFTFSFWVQFDSGSVNAQAMEFDAFQFVGTTKYTFGTQCNYVEAVWDVWNEGAGSWERTRVPCRKFQPGEWYHLTMTFHRTPDLNEHYDSLSIVQYNILKRIAGSQNYALNLTYPSGPLPTGWTENMGVQFQMDIGPRGTEMTEWVDVVSLTTF